MERLCFFCRKALPIERRAEIFCSPRCQELHRKLPRGAPAAPAPEPAGSAPAKALPRNAAGRSRPE